MNAPIPNIAGAPVSARADGWLAPMVVSLFFACGFATVMSDTLIPKLKALFELGYAETMLTTPSCSRPSSAWRSRTWGSRRRRGRGVVRQ